MIHESTSSDGEVGDGVDRGEALREVISRGPLPLKRVFAIGAGIAAGSDLWALPLDHPGNPRQLIATPFNEWSPRFSADGRWFAYQSDFSGRPEIYVRS